MNELSEIKALVRNAVLAEQGKKRPLETQANLSKTEHDEESVQSKSIHSKRGRKKLKKEEISYPIEPRIISLIKKPRTVVNHSYRDFSELGQELSYEKPAKIEDMTFSEKLHDVLSIEEYQPYISWMVHGRAFRVHIAKVFEEEICAKYFGHPRYSSFLRMLNNYGFKHITKGPDRNCYYHECFLRGMPHLCKYMPKPKNARHLIPDPDNEPNFYHLSNLFPLADQVEEIKIPHLSGRKPSPSTTNMVKSEAAGIEESDAYVSDAKLNHQTSVSSTNLSVLPIQSLFAGGQSSSASVITASSILHRQQLINRAAAQQAVLNNEAILRAAALRESLKKWTGGFRF